MKKVFIITVIIANMKYFRAILLFSILMVMIGYFQYRDLTRRIHENTAKANELSQSGNPGNRDSRDENLAKLVNEIATAILSVASGVSHDPKFDSRFDGTDLRSTPPDVVL